MSKYKEGALNSVATAIAAFLLTIASAPPAQTQTVELKFDSPPSAQGWIYRSECAPAFPQGINLPEASAFSLNNGLLRLDTAGRGTSFVDGYYKLSSLAGIDPTAGFTFEARLRVLAVDPSPPATAQAFSLNVVLGGVFYILQVGDAEVKTLDTISAPVNTTAFHTYSIVKPAGAISYIVQVDGAKVLTQSSLPQNSPDQVVFGDGTCQARNGIAEISSLRFSQGTSLPAPTNLQATQAGLTGTAVELTWDYGNDAIDGFSIERITPSESWGGPPITTVSVASACNLPGGSGLVKKCGYSDLSVPGFFTVSYRIQAYQGGASSTYSNPATAYQLQPLILPPSSSVIVTKFTPGSTLTVQGAAASLPPDDVTVTAQAKKFDHFNWISYKEHDSACYLAGDPLHAWQAGLFPGLETKGAAQFAPHLDPPPGGYFEYGKDYHAVWFYDQNHNPVYYPGPDDELPYYYAENPSTGSSQPWYLDPLYYLNPAGDLAGPDAGGDPSQVHTAQFSDQPNNGCGISDATQASEYSSYLTTLVGVTATIGAQASSFVPLHAFFWSTSYNGNSGGITAIGAKNVGPPVAGGTGSIFNVAIENISDLPLAMRQQLIQVGAQGVSTAPYVDTNAPMTTAFLSGQQGANGWYRGPVTVTLIATDIDGPSDIYGTGYTLDAGSLTAYTGPFTVSRDGIQMLEYGSVDRAANAETPRPSKTIQIDTTPPAILCNANLNPERSREGKTVEVTILGTMTDDTSGVGPSSPAYVVTDEDGRVLRRGAIALGTQGSYSLKVSLLPERNRTDDHDRDLKVVVTGNDRAGNVGTCSAAVSRRNTRGSHDDHKDSDATEDR